VKLPSDRGSFHVVARRKICQTVQAALDTRQTGNGCTNILLQCAHLNSKARYFPTRMRARNKKRKKRKKKKKKKKGGREEGGGGGGGRELRRIRSDALRARSLAGSQEVPPRLIDKPEKKVPPPPPPLACPPLAPGYNAPLSVNALGRLGRCGSRDGSSSSRGRIKTASLFLSKGHCPYVRLVARRSAESSTVMVSAERFGD